MKQQPGAILNRRARHDYDLRDGLKVGLVLNGVETKALRLGHAHLRGAYVTVKDNELWLINATISPGKLIAADVSFDETRSRKLLAKRKEIDKLIALKQQGLTIVPTRFLTRGRYVKLEIAPGRGMRKYDKREKLKQRESDRDNARARAR